MTGEPQRLSVTTLVSPSAVNVSLTGSTRLASVRTSSALIQGLRDYFGAHTYHRTDRSGTFHTLWAQDRSEVTR